MRLPFFYFSLFMIAWALSAEAQLTCETVHWNSVNPSQIFSRKEVYDWIQQGARAELAQLEPAQRKQVQETALETTERIKKLQRWSDRTREFNSNLEHVSVYEARRRLQQLKRDILLNNQTEAVGEYRKLFDQIENSYLKLQSNLAELQNLKNVKSARVTALETENKKLFKLFGEGFEEYLTVRTYLEKLIQNEPFLKLELETMIDQNKSDPGVVAFEILSQLGIPAEHRLSALIAKPAERISLKEMYEFNATHPEALIAKSKKDIRDDLMIFGKSLVLNNPVSTLIRSLIARMPTSLRVPLTKVFDLFMEKHLEHRYMNHIEDVVSISRDQRMALDTLRAKNAESDTRDEFLITFARITLFSQKWVEMKKYAHETAESSGSEIYKDFASRMDKAEKLAIRLGPFSPGQTDFKARLTRISVYGGAAYGIYELMPYLTIAEQAIRAQFNLQ